LFLSALFLLPKDGWIAFCAVLLASQPGNGEPWRPRCIHPHPLRGVVVGLSCCPGFLADSRGLYAPGLDLLCGCIVLIILVPLGFGGNLASAAGLVLAAGARCSCRRSALVDLRGVHPSLLLAVLGTVWISDTAAYFTGRRFGRHKLAPSIKSREDLGGPSPERLRAVGLYALAWAYLGSVLAWMVR